MKNTPENITSLKENEVFVFGSNLNGNHAGGAARLAADKFGATEGQGIGLQGSSYAIPTLDRNMQKMPIDELTVHVNAFIDYARLSDELSFYVTKIGCGIAGFEVSEIAPLFERAKDIENVILPKEFTDSYTVTKGFKGFDKDMKCRGFQYEEGKTYEMEGDPEACERGFHFCEHPLDVFGYYPPAVSRFHEVEGYGKASRGGDDTKVAVSKIKIGLELSLSKITQAAVKFVFDRATWSKEPKENATGNRGAASATGYQGAASATGYYGAASATGDQGAASATGYQGAAVALGIHGKAKAKLGGFITVSEWRQDNEGDWQRVDVKSVRVDGDKIKEDTYYRLVDGEFIED